MKQFLTQQLDFQKESIDKILDEERESHRIEIAKIKKTHEEEL